MCMTLETTVKSSQVNFSPRQESQAPPKVNMRCTAISADWSLVVFILPAKYSKQVPVHLQSQRGTEEEEAQEEAYGFIPEEIGW